LTRDDITRMAREAGFVGFDGDNGSLRRFAALVAAAEREACAKVCEEREAYSMPIPCPDGIPGCCVAHYVPGSRLKDGVECAEAIRARGQA